MHPNPIFHDAETDQNLSFARARGFGILAVNGAEAPMLSHIPFLLSDDGTTADLHLVRSNPIARALRAPLPAKLSVSGGDSYISPDWYGVPDQVPTWNYVAVHLTGTLERLEPEALLPLLDRQSAHYEAQLAPKPAWTTEKMTPEVLDKLMRMIVPCRMQIADVEGTWKLNQNKSDAARQRAADGVAKHGMGGETTALADLMRADRS